MCGHTGSGSFECLMECGLPTPFVILRVELATQALALLLFGLVLKFTLEQTAGVIGYPAQPLLQCLLFFVAQRLVVCCLIKRLLLSGIGWLRGLRCGRIGLVFSFVRARRLTVSLSVLCFRIPLVLFGVFRFVGLRALPLVRLTALLLVRLTALLLVRLTALRLVGWLLLALVLVLILILILILALIGLWPLI